MAKSYNIQNIIKHLLNGTLSHNLCRICLIPLDEYYEDIFTSVCKSDKQYCIADILEEVCSIKISDTDSSKICPDCFMAASEAYKFCLKTQTTEEILNYYVDEIQKHLKNIPVGVATETICLSLPIISPITDEFDYDITNFSFRNFKSESNDLPKRHNLTRIKQGRMTMASTINESATRNTDLKDFVVLDEKGEPIYIKSQNGSFVNNDMEEEVTLNTLLKPISKPKIEKKQKRNRNPMSYIMCSKCPIQYRFFGKLKQHMKTEHGIDLFMCKVCKAVVENEHEFNQHLQTHTGILMCAICNSVFKNRKAIIAHLKWHEEMKCKGHDSIHICEICGMVLFSEELLERHKDQKHVNKYTCYYCGRMYKVEASFDIHIKKHEMLMNNGLEDQKKQRQVSKSKRKYTCSTCGRDFVDKRALLWHERLHAGERPYACAQCGKRFVSLNRRNQHALCAHTAPNRRCPLCPALFHLRSMVNSHIKKVHLNVNKRRARSAAARAGGGGAAPVPLQELSVAVQNGLFKLRGAGAE